MSRNRSVHLAVAGLLIVVALVLTTSALSYQGGRHKRAIGRNATPWNVTDKFIPPDIFLLSRKPVKQQQSIDLELMGIPDNFPQEIKDKRQELIRYAYDGYFAGLGIIFGSAKNEQYMLANVESMYRACEMDQENATLIFRGWDKISDRPVISPTGTTWHDINDSFITRHILTFGHSGFGLFALKAKSGMRVERKAPTKRDKTRSSLSRVKQKRDAEYNYCWAYSMMHEYYDEEGVDIYADRQIGKTSRRFWGRWPVELVECDEASVCKFKFDRWFWINEPVREGIDDMPYLMKAQGFPCGWQDIGAPIYCAKKQEDEYSYDAVKLMQLKYIILKGKTPDPNKEPILGGFAQDCYEASSHEGSFTAYALDKILPFINKYTSAL